MTATIADIFTDGSGTPIQNAPIVSVPIPARGLLLNMSGSGFAPAGGPWPSDVTDGTGAFSLVFARPSESQPSTVKWVLRLGTGTSEQIWWGATPDVTGTYNLATLQATYDWASTDGRDLPADAQAILGLIPPWRAGTPLPVNLSLFHPQGEWNATIRYNAYDGVTDNGSTWMALASNLNSEPSTLNANWQLVSAAGLPGPQGPAGFGSISAPLFAQYSDFYASSAVLSGLHVTGSGTLTATVSAGTAYIAGVSAGARNVLAAPATIAVTPSATTFIDWDGTTLFNVTSTSPAVGRIRLAQTIANGTGITSVTDLRPIGTGLPPVHEIPITPFLAVYGGNSTGSVDCTAAVNAALAQVFRDGGGTLYFPTGTYLCSGQIVLPNDLGASPTNQLSGGPKQPTIRLLGDGARLGSLNGYSQLTLTYSGGLGGQITTMGTGELQIEKLALVDTNSYLPSGLGQAAMMPFIMTTNTILRMRHCSMSGHDPAYNSSADVFQLNIWLGRSCTKDGIQFGAAPGTGHLAYDGTLISNFNGYTSRIDDVTCPLIRRATIHGTFSNDIVTTNMSNPGGGNISTPLGPCFDIADDSNVSIYHFPEIEIGGYGCGVRIAGSSVDSLIHGGAWWDPLGPGISVQSPGIAPETHLTAASTTSHLTMPGYMPAGTTVAVESDPLFPLAADIDPTVITLSVASAGIAVGMALGTLDVDASGDPLPSLREWFTVSAVTGSGPYTITLNRPPHARHVAGTNLIALSTVLAPASGATLIPTGTNPLLVTNPAASIVTGSMVRVIEFFPDGKEVTGLAEWFVVQGVGAVNGSGQTPITLDRPTTYRHLAKQKAVSPAAFLSVWEMTAVGQPVVSRLTTISTAGVGTTSTSLDQTAFKVAAITHADGTQIQPGEQLAFLNLNSGFNVTVTAATSTTSFTVSDGSQIVVGATVTVGAQPTVAVTGVSGNVLTTAALTTTPSIGDTVNVHELSSTFAGTNVALPTGGSVAVEWFKVRQVIPGTGITGTLILDHAPLVAPTTGQTIVAFGSETTPATTAQTHATGSRVYTCSMPCSKYLPTSAELPFRFWFVPGVTTETFWVQSYTAAHSTTTSASIATNAASIQVLDATNIKAGAVLRLRDTTQPGTAYGVAQEQVIVANSYTPGSTTVPLNAANNGTFTTYPYPSGAEVLIGPFNLVTTPFLREHSRFTTITLNAGVIVEALSGNGLVEEHGITPVPCLDLDGTTTVLNAQPTSGMSTGGFVRAKKGVAVGTLPHRPNLADWRSTTIATSPDGVIDSTIILEDGANLVPWIRANGAFQPLASTLGAPVQMRGDLLTPDPALSIVTGNPAAPGLIITPSSTGGTQTADLIDIYDKNGVLAFSVSAAGAVVIPSLALGIYADPKIQNFLGWSFAPAIASVAGSWTSTTAYVYKIPVPKAVTISNLMYAINAAASGQTASANWMGLYDSTGARLWTSGTGTTQDALYTGTTNRLVTCPLSVTGSSGSSVVANPPFVWAMFVQTATTPAKPWVAVGVVAAILNGGLTAATANCGNIGAQAAGPPTSFTPSTIVETGNYAWVAVS
jgi:hypothetical protein